MALALTATAVPAAVVAQDTEKPQVLVWTDAVREPGFQAYAASVADSVDVTVELARPTSCPRSSSPNQAGSGQPDVVFAHPNEPCAAIRSADSTTLSSGRPKSPARDFLEASAKATSGA